MNIRFLNRSSQFSRYLVLTALILAITAFSVATALAQTSADYTQGVTSLNGTQARIWLRPTTASAFVDVHYLVNSGGQQNLRMTNNAGTWEQVVSGLASGTRIDYWFTYEKSGPAFDTPHFVYTHGGGTSPTSVPPTSPPSGTNIALNKAASASGSCNTNEGPNKAVNGSVSGGNSDKWCGNAATKWMQVDLGANANITRFVVKHAGAGGENAAWNTNAFNIQTSTDNVNWSTAVTVSGNTASTTTHNITARTARYVRLNITNAGGDGVARIYEFEVYGTGGGTAPTNTPAPQPTSGPQPTSVPPASFWGDTATIPAAANVLMVKFLNRTNGHYTDAQIFWNFNGVTKSISQQQYFDMPANSAGRMNFYLGSATSQYTDFIEFTVSPTVFNGNTTRVDWFGIKLAMRLHAKDGYDVQVGEDATTFAEDRAVTFQKFINEVPAQFDHLAQNWAPFRISAPGKMGDVDFTPSGVYSSYFTSYAQSVGVNASVFDIMACAGSLANNAAMCSALNRHVAHLAQSSWTNSSLFYQAAPANYYSKFWHDHSINKMAYGFPYDDYGSFSSFVSHVNPQWLIVAIGW